MTQFCAECTDEAGPFGILERDGRAYVACFKCIDGVHPREVSNRPVERGYNPSPSIGGLFPAARRADRALHGDTRWTAGAGMRTAVVSANSAKLAREYHRKGQGGAFGHLPESDVLATQTQAEAVRPEPIEQHYAVAELTGEPLLGAGKKGGAE